MNRQRKGFAVLDGKPNTEEQRRQAIEAELRALPEMEAPPSSWAAVRKRLDSGERFRVRAVAGWKGDLTRRIFGKRRLLRPAFAAGVALAAAIAAVLLVDEKAAPLPQQIAGEGSQGGRLPTAGDVPQQAFGARSPEGATTAWMERSRQAETRRRALPIVERGRLAAAQELDLPGLEARRLLAARIASVDASLNRLATVDSADPEARARLWRERAELMDTLVRAEQVQREALVRRAVY